MAAKRRRKRKNSPILVLFFLRLLSFLAAILVFLVHDIQTGVSTPPLR